MSLEKHINLENYEIFYLDYLEGTLSESEKVAFEDFLTIHPELRIEDELPVLIPQDLTYNLKTELKKGISQDINYTQTLLIGESENQNSTEESIQILNQIKSDTKIENEYRLYQKTIINPDLSIIFQNKSELKKRQIIVFWPWIGAAAASVVLMFTFYNFNKTDTNVVENVKGENKEKSEKTTIEKLPDNQTKVKLKIKKFEGTNPANIHDLNVEKIVLKSNNVDESKIRITNNRNIIIKPIFNIPAESPRLTNKNDITYSEDPIKVDEQNLSDLALNTTEEVSEKTTSQYYIRPFETMPNPISGITQIATQLTNTEIDFRKADATKRKSGGVHFKIGKFEYSRRKR